MAVLKGTSLTTLLTKLKNIFALKKDTVFSVNNITPTDGNVPITTVQLADNLTSNRTQTSIGNYTIRTTGGEAPVSTGSAYLMDIKGNMVHTGYVEESILPYYSYAARGEGEEEFNVSVDRNVFVAAVSSSQTLTFNYTSDWNTNPQNYGITVAGTPISGDSFSIVYTKLELGTITTATPSSFRATGWNLYDNSTGYARVIKYSDSLGFLIGGTYETISFATSMSSVEWTPITPTAVSGTDYEWFSITEDGYIAVESGSSDTFICYTWDDWGNGYEGEFEAYSESTVDISSLMSNYFPNGLCKIEDVYDEINFNTGIIYSKIGRLSNNSTNLSAVVAAEVAYVQDANYIYYVKPASATSPLSSAATYTFTPYGTYDANDHGNEYISGSSIPITIETMYGNNLKNKLETNVLTISQQALTENEKARVRNNIGAITGSEVVSNIGKIFIYKYYSYKITDSVAAGASKGITGTQLGVSTPTGYSPFAFLRVGTGYAYFQPYYININATGSSNVINIRNTNSSAVSNKTVDIGIMYIKNGLTQWS